MKKTLFLAISFIILAISVIYLTDKTKAASYSAGSLIALENKTAAAVYYIGDDGNKYVFPDGKTYFTWYENFNDVKKVNLATLDQYPDGGVVPYRGGTRLITHQNTAKIYAVEPGGIIRWLKNETIAKNLYGNSWATLVQDILPGYFSTSYTVGSELSDKLPEGTVIKQIGDKDYYIIENGLRRKLSAQAFTDNRLQFKYAIELNDLSDYPEGSGVSGEEDHISKAHYRYRNRNGNNGNGDGGTAGGGGGNTGFIDTEDNDGDGGGGNGDGGGDGNGNTENTIYVAADGSGDYTDISNGIDAATPGDTVLVKNGTYSNFSVTKSGTSAKPITIKADGTSVNINGSACSSCNDLINIEGQAYIIIDGFKINGGRYGIRLVDKYINGSNYNYSHDIQLINNTINGAYRSGILTGKSYNIKIENNITKNTIDQHGIYVSNGLTNDGYIKIIGNTSRDNGTSGIQVNGDCYSMSSTNDDGIVNNVLIEDNIVYNNTVKGLSLISMSNSTVKTNIIYNNGASAGGIHLTDEPSCNKASSNNIVTHNTIVEPNISAAIRVNDGAANNMIYNNIAFSNSTNINIEANAGSGNTNNNNFQRTLSAGNTSDSDITSNFVSYGNFELLASSGAIGYASDGSDAGALQFDGIPEPPPIEEDTEAPTNVNIVEPSNSSTKTTSSVVIKATANDDTAIKRVDFYVSSPSGNLGKVGSDSSADSNSHYSLTLYSNTLATNGSYTIYAKAFDTSDNSTDSTSISFTYNYTAPITSTPSERILLSDDRLSQLKQYALQDNSLAWQSLYNIAKGSSSYKIKAYGAALVYLITEEEQYKNLALSLADEVVEEGWTEVASENYHFLYVRDHMRNIGLVYNWLYDELSAEQKQKYANHLKTLMYLTYHDYDTSDSEDATEAIAAAAGLNSYSAFHDVFRPGWSTYNNENNFFYNYILGLAYLTYSINDTDKVSMNVNGINYEDSLYVSNPSNRYPLDFHFEPTNTDYTSTESFLNKNISHAFDHLSSAEAEGGGWHEGTQYGPGVKRHIFENLLIKRDVTGVNYFQTDDYAKEAAMFHIYAVQPGGEALYSGGDAGRDYRFATFDYDRHLMTALANGLQGTEEGQYAQYWLNTIHPSFNNAKQYYALGFLLDNPNLPAKSFSDLPHYYYASGYGWWNSRSSWNNDATSVSFMATRNAAGHMHEDVNAFQIFKGSSAGDNPDGWLVTDIQPFHKGTKSNSQSHNTIIVGGRSQDISIRDSQEARTLAFEAEDGIFTYSRGEAAPRYYDNWGVNTPGVYDGKNKHKALKTFLRDIIHILPGYVIVYDRVTPVDGYNPSIENYFHFRNQPQSTGLNNAQGDPIQFKTGVSGKSTVFVTSLLPSSVNNNIEEDEYRSNTCPSCYTGTFRIRQADELTSGKATTHFLNIFDVSGPNTNSTVPYKLVNTLSDSIVGAHIQNPSKNIITMFSTKADTIETDGSVNETKGTLSYSYDDLNKTVDHYIFNVPVNTNYKKTVSKSGGQITVQLVPNAGSDVRSSANGVLRFTTQS